jgi:nudix-type nucleoside diphosphatase (YffH/AdpP family)
LEARGCDSAAGLWGLRMALEICGVRTLHEGYMKLLQLTLVGDDGQRFTREIEDHGAAAGVLPYDAERRVALLVRLPRPAVHLVGEPMELLEAPAGMVDDESAETAARREALEEAGVRLEALEWVAGGWPSPGVSTERLDLFLAPYRPEDRVTPGGGVPGEHENITVVEIPLSELWDSLERRTLGDLKTATLLMALRLRQPALFEPVG